MSFLLGAPVPARLGWEAETWAEDQTVPCARVKVKGRLGGEQGWGVTLEKRFCPGQPGPQ